MIKYPEFVENKTYLGMDSSVSEKDQLWAMLNNLTRVHRLTADKFNSFDELIREYLILGCEAFGLETGIVSAVDPQGDYTVKDVVSPLEALEKNQVFKLEDTYCREVIKSQSVIGLPEVGKLDYMNCHPVYQNLKLEAYISAPIFVEETLYGTLNFTSVKPRINGFSIHERELITLMGNSIGNYIMLRSKESKLVELNARIKRFVGYVAHDLRNPIGTIIGLAKMGNRDNAPEEKLRMVVSKILITAESALEFVSTILENAALSGGKLSLTKEYTNLCNLLQQAQASVTSLTDDTKNTMDIQCPPELQVNCDENRIKQVLVNLFTNAAKYSPDNSRIAIMATSSEGKVSITIKNFREQHTQQSDGEHAIYGSTGFGLDIAREILSAHGSTLDIESTEDTYIVSFTL